MEPTSDRRAIPVYLLVTWIASGLFYFLIIKSTGTNAASGAYTSGLMWCPAIGAGQTRYQILSYLIPLGYSTITDSIAWLTGIAAINPIQNCRCFYAVLRCRPLSRPCGIGLYFLNVATIGVIQNSPPLWAKKSVGADSSCPS
jgi:hypothetical protein